MITATLCACTTVMTLRAKFTFGFLLFLALYGLCDIFYSQKIV